MSIERVTLTFGMADIVRRDCKLKRITISRVSYFGFVDSEDLEFVKEQNRKFYIDFYGTETFIDTVDNSKIRIGYLKEHLHSTFYNPDISFDEFIGIALLDGEL
jgi:hypothetical protein